MMTSQPSILRRAYEGVALFALLNMLALGGLVALLVSRGGIDTEKLRRLVSVLRDEDSEAMVAGSADTAVVAETAPTNGRDTEDPVMRAQIDSEILRLEAERIKTELNQRLALNNAILLRVTTERDRVREQQQSYEKARAKEAAGRQEEGFQKQIAIYQSLAPKEAVEHLLSLPQPDDAATILMAIDTRKAKKIIEAAKRPDHMEKMKAILRRVREIAPDRSAELQQDAT